MEAERGTGEGVGAVCRCWCVRGVLGEDMTTRQCRVWRWPLANTNTQVQEKTEEEEEEEGGAGGAVKGGSRRKRRCSTCPYS